MSQAKFTPGEWRWYLSDSGVDLRTIDRGQLLVMDYGGYPPRRPVLRFAERTDAMGGLMQPAHNLIRDKHKRPGFVVIDNPDARLISAAPELLAACEAMVQNWDHNGTPEQMDLAAKSARAAIVKATGGAA